MAKTSRPKAAKVGPPTCKYGNETYPSGAYICIDGICTQCQNGEWVPTESECAPGQNGKPCTPQGAAVKVKRPVKKAGAKKASKAKAKAKGKAPAKKAKKSARKV